MDWQRTVESLGIAGLLVLGIGVAARFTAREIIIPLRDRAITRFVTFCDRLDGILDRMEVRDAQVVALLDSFKSNIKRVDDRLEMMEDAWERVESQLAHMAGGSRSTAPRGPKPHPQPQTPPVGSDE